MTAIQRLRRFARLPLCLLALLLAAPCSLVAMAGFPAAAMRVWCAAAAAAVGLRVRLVGAPPSVGCLVVSNHLGYLDILALGATAPGCFLAMKEIAHWPLLGRLTRLSGAIFVDRGKPRSALPFLRELAQRFASGERVLLFPEAQVSSDGKTLGPFRPMFFQACADCGVLMVPVALRYSGPVDRQTWAWIEEPGLWRHLWMRVLPASRLSVEVRFGAPLRPGNGEDRKALAGRAWREVARLLEGASREENVP